MEVALYDPDRGYYSTGAERLGKEGDFFTAADAGHGFGHSIARQLMEIDRKIGPLDPFDVVEVGAGRGLLARDILDGMAEFDPSLAARLRYTMVDRSGGMRSAAARLVPEATCLAPEEITGKRRGCVIAVELFDALPCHRVRRRDGELAEVFVGVDAQGNLVEREALPGSEAKAMADRYGAAAEEGSEAEVAPLAPVQLEWMANLLEQGLVVIVDYGDVASKLYGPDRPVGTLLAYHGHATNQDYLSRVGEQDLTAHVNFSALEDRAREVGLRPLGLTTQDRFLIANGILETFESAEGDRIHDPARVKRRLQAMQLIHPEGMGRRFKVLVLSKGWEPAPQLDGLRDPFARDQR